MNDSLYVVLGAISAVGSLVTYLLWLRAISKPSKVSAARPARRA